MANGPAWIEALDRLEALGPRVVVPGHGEVGGPELIETLRAYLVEVRDAVAARVEQGQDVETMAAELGRIRARYESWTTPSGSTSPSATSTVRRSPEVRYAPSSSRKHSTAAAKRSGS